MAPSFRRRGAPPLSPPEAEAMSESEEEFAEEGPVEEEEEEEIEGMEEMGEEEDELLASPLMSPSHLATHLPPSNFREISTLASWTVSSSKPGCSIPQLRHPSTQQFWQSDGPQPHYLNIHFFKLVRIVGLRLYLDFEADESYTPTEIVLLAGSGMNDLVEWGEMRLESPRGWVWADFEGVGEVESGDEDEDSEEDELDEAVGGLGPMGGDETVGRPTEGTAADDTSDFENTAPREQDFFAAANDPMILDSSQHPAIPIGHGVQLNARAAEFSPDLPRPHPRHPFAPLSGNTVRAERKKKPKLPVLRCHLVQIKILKNHQNGKDTHLRGLQIFALDNEKEGLGTTKVKSRVPAASNGLGEKLPEARKKSMRGLMKSEWMAEPNLR